MSSYYLPPKLNHQKPKSTAARLLIRTGKLLLLIYIVVSTLSTTYRLLVSDSIGRHSTRKRSPKDADVAYPVQLGANDQDLDVIMSKLFQLSMKPTKITPYFLRATYQSRRTDVTIATIIDASRFDRLVTLAKEAQGPISVAIHVNAKQGFTETVRMLQELQSSEPAIAKYVDAHLIVDRFDRQFNLWRNVARLFARSDFILQLDVDFLPCTDFGASIRSNPQYIDMLRSGNTVFVLPAFEYYGKWRKSTYEVFPKNKSDLIQQVNQGKLDMFHRYWPPGHQLTNYSRWYNDSEDYEVLDFDLSYEPYVIFDKYTAPWCDERFVGYGSNKAACLFELYLTGATFRVLPNDFVIHQAHTYPESERQVERNYNRRLYEHFREETCIRYNRMAPKASNLGAEKIADYQNCRRFLLSPPTTYRKP